MGGHMALSSSLGQCMHCYVHQWACHLEYEGEEQNRIYIWPRSFHCCERNLSESIFII
jgi:hypothetical protein